MNIKNAGIKPADILIFALVLSATIASALLIYGGKTGRSSMVRIESPHGSWLYPLDRDTIIEIPGTLGNTTIAIQNGSASIIASPCPNQTCLSGPKIQNHGDWNACLPNRIILRGEGSPSNDDIDIIAQ